ncbi:MAG TPA: diacylglycerol kinase family protein [Stellaceae bacterium]|nr:diacylglycerol kinase family protein [Stellaceae bacterium]
MVETDLRARRLLVIYNPTSGRRKRSRLRRWLAHLATLGASVSLAETKGPRHAEALAQQADPQRFDAVAVAGGDGTINEAVNGLRDSPLPLAILPLGTANVLAAELGLPRALAALAQIAAFSSVRRVWPGEAAPLAGGGPPRRFLVMAGIGFDAEVVEHVDLPLKRRFGKLAYVSSILGRLRQYRPSCYRAEVGGSAVEGSSLVVAKSHFYGGRFVLAPAARLDEPSFEVVVFGQGGRGAALRYMAAVGMGLLGRCRSVRIMTSQSVNLLEPVGAPIQLDGDVELRLPARLAIAATPLSVVAPMPLG